VDDVVSVSSGQPLVCPRRCGEAWISISTLMKEAGFAERNNARRVVEDLHKANIIPKTQRPPTGEVRCYSTNLYEVPKEADLLDLVFASATGITALYAYVLRKLWVDEGGVGSAYLTRKGVRDALAEGVLDKDGKLVLNRMLSDTKIVEHLGTLLSSKTVLKVDNGRVTIPAARGYQPVKVGATRVWDRKDRGTKKLRRVAQIKSFANLPAPPFVDAVSPPPPVGSANLSPPPNGVYPNFAPPKPRQTPFSIKNTEGPSPAEAIHLSPQTASGTPSALADISTIDVVEPEAVLEREKPEIKLVTRLTTSAGRSLADDVEAWRRAVEAAGDNYAEGYRRLAALVPVNELVNRVATVIGPAMVEAKRWNREAARQWSIHKLRKTLLCGADDRWLVQAVHDIGADALDAGRTLSDWTAVSARFDAELDKLGGTP
jgi:hypothetical protein